MFDKEAAMVRKPVAKLVNNSFTIHTLVQVMYHAQYVVIHFDTGWLPLYWRVITDYIGLESFDIFLMNMRDQIENTFDVIYPRTRSRVNEKPQEETKLIADPKK